MRTALTYIVSFLLAFAIASTATAVDTGIQPHVSYVAPEGVYLDGGLTSGINVGDTVAFIRDGETVALGVVTKVSDEAAATEVAQQKQPVRIGDVAALLSKAKRVTTPKVTLVASSVVEPKPSEPVASKPRKASRLKGTISVQNFWHNDLTDTDRDRTQPGFRSRLSVTNLGGTDLTLSVRQHSRLYHRSSSLYAGQDTDDWVHRIYELGIFHEVKESKTEWALGRVLSPYVRGVGYVDGGYLAHQIHKHWKIGVAGGTIPDRMTSEPDFDRRKLGLFASFETGEHATGRIAFTAALSTEYLKSTVSRDFMYLQGTYSKNRVVNIYQSVEIDLNRDWRYDWTGDRFTFTNYYGNATVYMNPEASVFFSYDARKNIRYIEIMDTPDSLFDDDTHQGIRTGFNWHISKRVYIRAHGGIRFREGLADDNRFAAATLRINKFPLPRHSVTLSMNVVETQFTTGYRPMLRYRLPLARRLTLNLTGSGYIYDTGSKTTSYYYGDVNTYYNFARRYYLSASIRQYFDSQLESFELRTELGVRL